jgi:DNA helicase II / ATP-dependent DNA helicase PcrA
MVAEDLLKDLNATQKKVASTTEGALLVLAGAGTGKTRCIIYRAGYLVASGRVNPQNLLIVTFTNKAARELRQRLASTFNLRSSGLWVGTFHSIFGRILRFEAKHLPFSSNYVIYDERDQKNLIKQIFTALNIDIKQYKPQVVRNLISRQKNNLIKPEQFWEFNDKSPHSQIILRIYLAYQKELLSRNALDFDDILLHTAFLFAENKAVLAKWQKVFRYIMIDEYQDTNYAQFEIIHHLAGAHQNICVVGDDDQAIYTWRGATIKNILNFESDYENVQIIKLERNYRSHANILNLANSLIAHNSGRHGKELFTDLITDEYPELTALDDDAAEAFYLAELIQKFKETSPYSHIAVLYRTNAQSRILEKIFFQKKIPYKIYGGVNFYQRKEIKDVLCFLRMLANPADTDSIQRALSLQPGIGKTTQEKLQHAAENSNQPLAEIILSHSLDFLAKRAAGLIDNFRLLWQDLEKAAAELSIYQLVWLLFDKTDLASRYGITDEKDIKKKKTFEDPEIQSRYENICELMTSIREFIHEYGNEHHSQPQLTDFLANATLQTDLDTGETQQDTVNLMTMHNAKGLEFEHVMIIGMEDGLLPHHRSLQEKNMLEEERRLLYVGITRAKRTLHFTLARYRRTAGGLELSEPSRFINEFDRQFLDEKRYDPHAYLKPSRPKRYHTPAKKVVLESQKHFKIGQIIKHVNFGNGVILSVDGQGRDARLTIKFDGGLMKTIVGNYVEVI